MKLDRQATQLMRENRYFLNSRSQVKRDNEYKLHLFPKGVDIGALRHAAAISR